MGRGMTQEEWEGDMAERALGIARADLLSSLPFMGRAIGALEYRRSGRLEALATDGDALIFSPGQVLRVFKGNMLFLDRAYLHCVLHCVFSHPWIMPDEAMAGGDCRAIWDLSCDIEAEYVIDGMGADCTRRILSWARQKVYEWASSIPGGASAAAIYRMLLGAGREERERLAAEFYTDDHAFWPRREDSAARQIAASSAKKKWEKVARQSCLEQEIRGSGASDAAGLLGRQLDARRKRRSYRDFLRHFAAWREEARVDPDEFDLGYYAYGLRLYGNLPLIEPLETREAKKISELAIVIDTSESTSGGLIEGFLRETADVLGQEGSFFKDAKIRILQCDNRVRREDVVCGTRGMEEFVSGFSFAGGGGTDFRPAFARVEELCKKGEIARLAGLLYFTDGKGTYPKARPPFATAFLFLGDYDGAAVPPWAMRMRLDPLEIGEWRAGGK